MKVGLFFGTFNPIHIGHLIIANYFVENSHIDKVWFVVTPQNPFKQKSSLLNEYERLKMVETAIEDNERLSVSNVEFMLKKPSYTIDTLTKLTEMFPKYEFSLIMGGDNLDSFHKWKNYETILKYYHLLVYRREGFDLNEWKKHPKVTILDVPLLNISASLIRNMIKEEKSVKYLIPDKVNNYIEKNSLYR
ncbi:MAG: nicotinate-nucleotide adenylyltransferase [Chitinophagaceae bacterium]|nr:MAG: nicotinate-nucleotide adenylyltransferase [Chitinophagaceae bacterium]